MKESTNWLCTVAAYTKKTGKRKKYGHRQNALTTSNVYHFERRQFRGIYLFPCRAQRKLNNTFSVLTVTLRFSHTYVYLLAVASSAQAASMHALSSFSSFSFFFSNFAPFALPPSLFLSHSSWLSDRFESDPSTDTGGRTRQTEGRNLPSWS